MTEATKSVEELTPEATTAKLEALRAEQVERDKVAAELERQLQPPGPNKKEPDAPAKPTPEDPRDEAMKEMSARAKACEDELVVLLRKHNCQIVAVLNSEKIGTEQLITKAFMSANWHLVPNQPLTPGV